jgi:hypothetical protein
VTGVNAFAAVGVAVVAIMVGMGAADGSLPLLLLAFVVVVVRFWEYG